MAKKTLLLFFWISAVFRQSKATQENHRNFTDWWHSPSAQRENDVRFRANVFHGGSSRSNLPPEDTVENLNGILFALKVYPVHIPQQGQNKACVVHFLAELGQHNVRLLVGLVAEQQLFHVGQLSRQILLSLQLGQTWAWNYDNHSTFPSKQTG